MPLKKITTITGTGVPILGADIDTDRIIPARFLKCITFDELSGQMFWDERFDEDGLSKGHPIDEPKFKNASIIIAGPNFGCGSSREHAPQTIKRSGINAIIGETFAEIFFGNSVGIGLPCLSATPEDLALLTHAVTNTPEIEITLDLLNMTASWGDQHIDLTMPETAREALTTGKWDAVVELMGNEDKVDELSNKFGYIHS